MMSKEKQIVEIKECIDAVYGADCAYYDVDGFAIADKIYNAGYRKQEWISVDERLPEEYDIILCFDGSDVQPSVFLDGEFIEYDRYEGDTIYGVTHWMPLPEAPKGGAE